MNKPAELTYNGVLCRRVVRQLGIDKGVPRAAWNEHGGLPPDTEAT